jgi:ArsR family metal-binding transcriptional regulator
MDKTHPLHLTKYQMIVLCRLVGAVNIENMKSKDDALSLLDTHERLKATIKEAENGQ